MQTLVWEGQSREIVLHVPAAMNAGGWPLVILLHAGGGSARYASRAYGLVEKAERERFVAVFPEALGTPRTWNALPEVQEGGADDAAYLEAVIDALTRRLPIDARRLYAIGHSNGGTMTYRIAAQPTSRFAAVAIVGGSIGAKDPERGASPIGTPLGVVGVLHIHGAQDKVVPLKGGPPAVDTSISYLSMPETTAFWLRNNRCRAQPAIRRVANLIIEEYATCRDRSAVQTITITDGTHLWPTGLRLARERPTPTIDVIWSFLSRHARGVGQKVPG